MSSARVRPFSSGRAPMGAPAAIGEAEEALADSLHRSARLIRLVSAEVLRWEGNDVPLTEEEARLWRAAAHEELSSLYREANRLRLWLRARRVNAQAPPSAAVRVVELLRPCVVALRRVHKRGHFLEGKTLAALTEASHFLGQPPLERLDRNSFLDEMRACVSGTFRMEVTYATRVALGLDDPSFLDPWLERWRAGAPYRPSDDALGALPPVAEALASFGRSAEAVQLLRGVQDEDGAYAWLMIAKVLRDQTAFRAARTIAEQALPTIRLGQFLLRASLIMRDVSLLREASACAARLEPPKGPKAIQSQRTFFIALFRAWLAFGEDDEARALLERVSEDVGYGCEAMILFAGRSHAPLDRDALLVALEPSVAPSRSLGWIVRALLRCGYRDEALAVVEARPDPGGRCIGYAALALASEPPFRDVCLERAEEAYWGLDLRMSELSRTLELFVRAELQAGRIALALNATGMVDYLDIRLHLLLAIYVRTEGRPEPAFLREWYERP